MLYNILLIIQIIVALGIISLVLIQHGKGADAGAAFGGGASGTVFGSRGAGNFLSRTTAILAVVFFLNSMALAWLVRNSGSDTGSSLVDTPAAVEQVDKAAQDVPTAPANDVPGAEEGGSGADVPAAPASDAGQADVPAASAGPAEASDAPAAGAQPADVPK